MNTTLKRALVLFFALPAMAAATDGAGPARAQLEQFADGLQSFQAEFTQTVRSQDGSVQDETSGKVWLQTPDRLRWAYGGDFPEIIVADGSNIWIHDVALEQVTVKPQSGQAADSPLMILSDTSQMDGQFMVTEVGDFEGMQLLELKSRDSEADFERILLGLDTGGIRMMTMEDAFGQRTEIHFQNPLRNEPLDEGLFRFTPPAGADVVGVAALPD